MSTKERVHVTKRALVAGSMAADSPSGNSNTLYNRNVLAGAIAATLMAASPGAFAQSTAGSVFGQASAGETVIIESPATGIRRESAVGSDGSYRVPALPPGQYKVTLKKADGTTSVRDGVLVSAGTGTAVSFATETIESVIVTGARVVNPIDVSSVESTTILSAEQLSKIPVARDLTSAALLAPGTVRGDNAFSGGNLASFGGSSVAENQYYVNGFNVTNSFRSLNFSKIPFEGVAEQQVKTGGYGAEFGRSLGGVVSQTTKRGTNEFKAGGNVFFAPESLRASTRNYNYSNPFAPDSLGKVRSYNSEEQESQINGAVWASGALVQDKLFAYALLGYTDRSEDVWGNETLKSNFEEQSDAPTWLLKLDWNISDSHALEFTAFSDKEEVTNSIYANNTASTQRLGKIGTVDQESGGENFVAKYTGYLTDSFTISALAGHGEFSRSMSGRTASGERVAYSGDLLTPATGCPTITDARSSARRAITGTYASTCNLTLGLDSLGSLEREDAKDTRDQYRVDAEWELSSHLLRFGVDVDNYESVAGTSIEGGRLWRYATDANGTPTNTADDYDVVRQQIVNQGSTVKVEQLAYYVEDNWNITDNFLVTVGLRWDTFENINGQGETYVKIENQFGPRLGFSWDVQGDSSLKVYGNAGRYALPLTPSVAVRGASASLFTRQEFTFTGVDPVTGAPLGIAQAPRASYGFRYVNGEFGEPKNPKTIASQNLDPMYQDEFILGAQMRITDSQNIGARAIYRELKAAIDDNCDYNPIIAAGEAGGIDAGDMVLPGGGFPYCRMFNPGEDAVFLTDFEDNGTLTRTTIAGDLLSPEARRTYKALELFWDGSWDRTFVQASYTLSYNKGNTEGGVKSDIGQGDTNVTQDFDYKELTVDSYGYLPNDRRHAIKVFGSYALTDELSIGANLVVQSGRPQNCLGVLYPYNGGIHPYGSSFFRCGTTDAGGRDGPSEAVPRGTAGRLPWTNTVDLAFAYEPGWAEGLQLKMDVFNVFNEQETLAVEDRAEDPSTGAPASTYLVPRASQTPRYFRFLVQYDF
jgi:hypothetical protein